MSLSDPSEQSRIGKKGTVVIPASLRKRFGLTEGSAVIAEATPEGVLIRPAITVPVELYSPVKKAELLLNTAIDHADYQRLRGEVEKLGLNPDDIEHARPPEP